MIYILPILSLTCLVLGYLIVRDLTKDRDFWHAKHDEKAAELEKLNHSFADAAMHKLYGRPVFGVQPEKEEPINIFETGADRVEEARQKAIKTPVVLTDGDMEHLNQIPSGGVQ